MLKFHEFHDRHEGFTEKLYNGELDLPHRYAFVLTNICNLRCDFCFQDRDRRSDAMTIHDWLSVVKQLPDYARVTLTGGEPLAFKKFEEIFHAVSDKHQCNMITNGLLLNEKRIDLLLSKPNFKVLSISIDDIGNEIRDVKVKQWNKMLEVLKYFHRRKKELKSDCVLDIKTVVLDSNSQDLYSIHKYSVETLGANTHAFMFLKGSDLQHSDTMSDMEEMFKPSAAPVYENIEVIYEQLELIRKYNQTSQSQAFSHPKVCDLSSSKPLPSFNYLNMSEFEKNNYHKCKFPWSSVHINVDGNMFPCIAFSMGNVKTHSLEEIIQSEETKKFRSALKKSLVEGCNRCGWIRPKDSQDIIPIKPVIPIMNVSV
jgi:MoaA/NifB/PqqE/SkfB family radical SAM enzyme